MTDPFAFILFSRYLFENLDDLPGNLQEASIRTAISRIYYGILHVTQMQFKINVPESKKRYYHAHVISELEKIADDEILINFNYLKNARTDSDYNLNDRIHQNELKNVIKCKDRLLSLIKEKPAISFDIDEERKFFRKGK